MNGQAEAEFVDGLDDDAGFEVESGAGDVFVAVESEANVAGCGCGLSGHDVALSVGDGDAGVVEIFFVVDEALIVNIVDANADAPVDGVHQVAAEVDFIFVDVAALFDLEVADAVGAVAPESVVGVGGAGGGVYHIGVIGEDAEPRGVVVGPIVFFVGSQ